MASINAAAPETDGLIWTRCVKRRMLATQSPRFATHQVECRRCTRGDLSRSVSCTRPPLLRQPNSSNQRNARTRKHANGVPFTSSTTMQAWRTRCPAKSGTRATCSRRIILVKAALPSTCGVSSAKSRNNLDDSPIAFAFKVNRRPMDGRADPRGPLASSRFALAVAHRASSHHGVIMGTDSLECILLALEAPRRKKNV